MRSPWLHFGESPQAPSPFRLIDHLAAPALTGCPELLLGAARGLWPEGVSVPIVALSPGAFRLTGLPLFGVEEAPWTGADVLPFLLAALGLTSEDLRRRSASALVRDLPAGPFAAVGEGAGLDAMEAALRRAGRRSGSEPALILSGRRPPPGALGALLRQARPGAVVVHLGLQEEVSPSDVETLAGTGLRLVSCRWGQEGDLFASLGSRRVTLTDSPLRVRRLLTRLHRAKPGRREGRSRAGSA